MTAVTTAISAPGQAPMVYGRYAAPMFEGVGEMITPGMSAYEAFKAADLDWKAVAAPCNYTVGETVMPIPSKKAIIRNDTNQLLGVHSLRYTPLQNDALVQILDYLREDINLCNIVSMGNGKRIYATAEIGVEAEVREGDRIRRYLHLYNSHDGSSQMGIAFTDVRLWCANQLRRLMSKKDAFASSEGAQSMKARHTKSIVQFASKLPERINLERRSFDNATGELMRLDVTKLTSGYQVDQLLTQIYDAQLKVNRPADNPRQIQDVRQYDAIMSNLEGGSGIGINTQSPSMYDLFNAITQYETHERGNSSRRSDVENARKRLEKLWTGSTGNTINHAREVLVAATFAAA